VIAVDATILMIAQRTVASMPDFLSS